jgi:hypothetical protein
MSAAAEMATDAKEDLKSVDCTTYEQAKLALIEAIGDAVPPYGQKSPGLERHAAAQLALASRIDDLIWAMVDLRLRAFGLIPGDITK